MWGSNSILQVFTLCLGFTLFSLMIHTLPQVNTMVNYADKNQPKNETLLIANGFLSWAVNYHKTQPDFKKRPITTFLIEFVANVFELRIALAFVVVNFLFLFLCGFLIYYLAKLYSLSHSESMLSALFFYCSFSVLLAYFIPIATYDDPIQYFFILLSFIALKQRQLIFFSLSFTIAIIARESSIILLPGIVLFILDIDFSKVFQEKIKIMKRLVVEAFPVIFYFLFLVWFYSENPEIYEESKNYLKENRFGVYEKNFRNIGNFIRTFLSFSSVMLLPISLLIIFKKERFNNRLTNAFWLTVVLNTGVVLLSVFAEESRVFALPLLILFPIFGGYLVKVKFSENFIRYIIVYKRLVPLVLVTVVSYFFYEFLYGLTDLNSEENFYVEYNTLAALIVGIIIYNKMFTKVTKG